MWDRVLFTNLEQVISKMITGIVRNLKPRIRLIVRGPRGHERRVNALVDSGYNGLLTLPSEMVMALALPWQSAIDVTLADGSNALFSVYELNMQVRPGGKVTIKRLP